MQKRKCVVNPSQKKSTSGTLSYNDAGEEGLCFGWIDSKLNKLDNETYKLLYSPRKSKSVWSKINKTKIEWLIKEGLMQLQRGQEKETSSFQRESFVKPPCVYMEGLSNEE